MYSKSLAPPRWRDEFWVRDGVRVHLFVNVETETVEITPEALAAILRDAGWEPDPDAGG